LSRGQRARERERKREGEREEERGRERRVGKRRGREIKCLGFKLPKKTRVERLLDDVR
jgi:hypothetical protein